MYKNFKIKISRFVLKFNWKNHIPTAMVVTLAIAGSLCFMMISIAGALAPAQRDFDSAIWKKDVTSRDSMSASMQKTLNLKNMNQKEVVTLFGKPDGYRYSNNPEELSFWYHYGGRELESGLQIDFKNGKVTRYMSFSD